MNHGRMQARIQELTRQPGGGGGGAMIIGGGGVLRVIPQKMFGLIV